jgi:hypothetical protein
MAGGGGAAAPQGGGQGQGGGDAGGGQGGGAGAPGTGGQGRGGFGEGAGGRGKFGGQGGGRDGGTQGGGEGGAGGQEFDFRGGFQQQQRELQNAQGSIKKLMGELESHKKATKGSTDVLDRIRTAITGGEEAKQQGADPTKVWEQQLDYYLSEAVEAEKAGRGIPLTTNLAVQLFQNLIAHHEEKATWQKRLDALEGNAQRQNDPQTTINNSAFSNLDNHVRRGLDQLYGPGKESLQVKANMFDAVGESISQEINHLSKTDFLQWDSIRRDPAALQALAQKHIRAMVPPQALKIIEQERLQNTRMGIGELRNAFEEARQIQDPQKRSEIMTAIRQDIWEAMYKSGKLKLRD